MYKTLRFTDAKEQFLQPPWGYQSWSQVEEDNEYDFGYLNGIWWVKDNTSFFVAADGGEPEDQTLTRDWAWVAGALNDAYAAGVLDGIDAGLKVDS
jgi:hypothetical protein